MVTVGYELIFGRLDGPRSPAAGWSVDIPGDPFRVHPSRGPARVRGASRVISAVSAVAFPAESAEPQVTESVGKKQ